MAAPRTVDGVEAGNTETGLTLSNSSSGDPKRPQFGTRFLTDPRQVFQHNAWSLLSFYFQRNTTAGPVNTGTGFTRYTRIVSSKTVTGSSQSFQSWPHCVTRTMHFIQTPWAWTSASRMSLIKNNAGILQLCLATTLTFQAPLQHIASWSDPGLFVYCCDFSSTAVELVKGNPEYDSKRCFAFVHDLSEVEAGFPIPVGTLDVIVLIFVLSALHPDKMQASISRLARLLKPGGVMLLRDYGRYDMAQLRFKKDELHELFTEARLEKVQNLVDRRLQVNRGKQLTMYRVWIQCKPGVLSRPPRESSVVYLKLRSRRPLLDRQHPAGEVRGFGCGLAWEGLPSTGETTQGVSATTAPENGGNLGCSEYLDGLSNKRISFEVCFAPVSPDVVSDDAYFRVNPSPLEP
ncbi:hypothetical protein GOODEAATRI_004782 [Goodea atripinnis]|uniref:Methyltransferase type 12 domain-containing protein n=1 Tax=Goodea atripinnis TaxID=208336 RepID=A0ABV0MF49_9TELE